VSRVNRRARKGRGSAFDLSGSDRDLGGRGVDLAEAQLGRQVRGRTAPGVLLAYRASEGQLSLAERAELLLSPGLAPPRPPPLASHFVWVCELFSSAQKCSGRTKREREIRRQPHNPQE